MISAFLVATGPDSLDTGRSMTSCDLSSYLPCVTKDSHARSEIPSWSRGRVVLRTLGADRRATHHTPAVAGHVRVGRSEGRIGDRWYPVQGRDLYDQADRPIVG